MKLYKEICFGKDLLAQVKAAKKNRISFFLPSPRTEGEGGRIKPEEMSMSIMRNILSNIVEGVAAILVIALAAVFSSKCLSLCSQGSIGLVRRLGHAPFSMGDFLGSSDRRETNAPFRNRTGGEEPAGKIPSCD